MLFLNSNVFLQRHEFISHDVDVILFVLELKEYIFLDITVTVL